jgi:hypothetical protein
MFRSVMCFLQEENRSLICHSLHSDTVGTELKTKMHPTFHTTMKIYFFVCQEKKFNKNLNRKTEKLL